VNHLVNRAGVTLLSRLTRDGKALGDVFAAYLDADRESGAEALRDMLTAAGLGAQREQEGLLGIEDVLEELTRHALEGKKTKPASALDPLRRKLQL
jgi:hypothetical protein